jgi:GNAT superfamily N-acetyltransferase
MAEIDFHILTQGDQNKFQLIASWYLEYWKIPTDKSIKKLEKVAASESEFHVLMTLDNVPIATGGLHHHTGLQDKVPRFKIYKDWLALVYTIPGERGKGYGGLLCSYITNRARERGMEKIYLYTDTAENLYQRLGWSVLEKVAMGERNVTVMNLEHRG